MTKKIEWLEDYALGLTEIDSQHQSLFLVINRLIESAQLAKGREVAAGIAMDS